MIVNLVEGSIHSFLCCPFPTSAADEVSSTLHYTDDCDAAAGADDEAAAASASSEETSTSPLLMDLNDAVSADQGPVTTSDR